MRDGSGSKSEEETSVGYHASANDDQGTDRTHQSHQGIDGLPRNRRVRAPCARTRVRNWQNCGTGDGEAIPERMRQRSGVNSIGLELLRSR